MLNTYLTQTRDLLKDDLGLFYTTAKLTRYVNQARSKIAQLTGCLPILVPGAAPYGGSAVPGSMIPGAAVPGSSTTTFNTIVGVEKYPFSYANAYAQAQNANIKGIVDVSTVAISWGGIRPMMRWMPWDELQAYGRSYNIGVTSYPFLWSTYGDGELGQVWIFPIPTQALEMEWGTFCAPKDLTNNSQPESIPSPFKDSVQFYAAHLAYLQSQRYGQAQIMLELFEKNSGISRVASDRGKVPDYYWNQGYY